MEEIPGHIPGTHKTHSNKSLLKKSESKKMLKNIQEEELLFAGDETAMTQYQRLGKLLQIALGVSLGLTINFEIKIILNEYEEFLKEWFKEMMSIKNCARDIHLMHRKCPDFLNEKEFAYLRIHVKDCKRDAGKIKDNVDAFVEKVDAIISRCKKVVKDVNDMKKDFQREKHLQKVKEEKAGDENLKEKLIPKHVEEAGCAHPMRDDIENVVTDNIPLLGTDLTFNQVVTIFEEYIGKEIPNLKNADLKNAKEEIAKTLEQTMLHLKHATITDLDVENGEDDCNVQHTHPISSDERANPSCDECKEVSTLDQIHSIRKGTSFHDHEKIENHSTYDFLVTLKIMQMIITDMKGMRNSLTSEAIFWADRLKVFNKVIDQSSECETKLLKLEESVDTVQSMLKQSEEHWYKKLDISQKAIKAIEETNKNHTIVDELYKVDQSKDNKQYLKKVREMSLELGIDLEVDFES